MISRINYILYRLSPRLQRFVAASAQRCAASLGFSLRGGSAAVTEMEQIKIDNRDRSKWENWDSPEIVGELENIWEGRGLDDEKSGRAEMVRLIGTLPPINAALDAGCGTGRMLGAFPPDSRYVGVDIAWNMLTRGRAAHPKADFIRGDLFKLPFRAKAFDVVVCAETLEHIPGAENALRELVRVAKKFIIICTHMNAGKTQMAVREIEGASFYDIRYGEREFDELLTALGLKTASKKWCSDKDVVCLLELRDSG